MSELETELADAMADMVGAAGGDAGLVGQAATYHPDGGADVECYAAVGAEQHDELGADEGQEVDSRERQAVFQKADVAIATTRDRATIGDTTYGVAEILDEDAATITVRLVRRVTERRGAPGSLRIEA